MTTKRSTLLALLMLAAALSTPALPALAATDAAAFATAMAEFTRALDGADAAVDPAAEQLIKLSQAEPQDPVLRAYAGAATSLRARTMLLPWKKMNAAEDGLALIDKALAQLTPAHDAPLHRGTPASLETRFVAAGTFLAMPSMLNRGPRGAKLLDEVLKSPLLDSAPLGFKVAVWMRAGLEAAKAEHKDEARQWFNKVAASGAPQASAAQARLKAL